MRRITMSGILCLITIITFGQPFQVFKGDTINRKDNKGLKQGTWRKYYRTDTLCSETIFKDDKPVGITRTWYESGKLKGEVRNEGKDKLSAGVTYFENGKKMAEGYFRNQLKDSIWIYFQETGDTISSIEQYKNGIPHGSWKVFYKNGVLAHELNYVNGEKHGQVKEFNEEGKVIFEIQYKNGKENGLSVLYYPDGKLREKGNYKNGERDGKWQQFDADGKVVKEVGYKNGVEEVVK